MTKQRISVLLLVIAALLLSTDASAYRRMIISDSLRNELPSATNPRDSLNIYLNLLDLSNFRDRVPLVKEIFHLAQRTHNITVQLEMLQRMANLYSQFENRDSLFDRCEQVAGTLPESDMQRATQVFIDMIRITAKSHSLEDSTRNEFFRNEILSYRGDDRSSLGEQIRHHYAVMMYIGGRWRHPLLSDNIDELGELIRRLPVEMENVRNLFYTQAAIMYTRLGDKEKAVRADRYMIDGMKVMAERYKGQSRPYRSYQPNIYNCIRRMMMNYKALNPSEIDSLYARAQQLAAESPDVASDMKRDERVEAYYLLAKGRDAEAIPILMRQIDNPTHLQYRHILLNDLVEAAERTGNREVLLKTMPLYIQDLEERYSQEMLRGAVGREIDYRLSDYRRSKEQTDREIFESRERLHRIVLVSAVVLSIVLLSLIVLLYRLYSRSKRLSRSLEQTNEKLVAERDKLRRSQRDLIAARDRANNASAMKSDFISNMSREVTAPLSAIVEYSQFIVDNMDAGRRKYMETFADVVTLSADLLQTLINDALDTSSIEKSEVEITRRPIAVNSICNMAMANMRKRMKPGVKLILDADQQDETIITTDPQRVEQVLINLLSNAAKFTEAGSVTLSYSYNDDLSKITFAVTDTGIGIPGGKEHIIFERFEKLDSHTQGSGLGLYICSLLTKLLDGELRVDTDYTDGGARFLFTIPT